MRNDGCFWAVAALAGAIAAGVFLALFCFGLLTAADMGVWIAVGAAVLLLAALLSRFGPFAAAAAPPPSAPAPAAPAAAQPAFGRPRCPRCYGRWLGAVIAAAATLGFGAAFLSTPMTAASVAALVFFFLTAMSFAVMLIALVWYAACRLR